MKKNCVALIPARGGSKGLKNKNLKKINGKTLTELAINFAINSKYFNKIILSSDSKKILNHSKKNIILHKRNRVLSSDKSSVVDTVKEVIFKYNLTSYDFMFILEPSSPLRNIKDLQQSYKILEKGYDSVCSFSEAFLNPLRAWIIKNNHIIPFFKSYLNLKPRQSLPKCYQPIGNIIGFDIKRFLKENKNIFFGKFGYFLVNRKRAVDIDDAFDFFIVKNILLKK